MSSLLSDAGFYSVLQAMNRTQLQQKTAMLRMSSGSRINSAADDPAGLIASEMLGSSLTSVQAASDNASRANAMMNVADGAVGQISSLVTDIQSLSLSLANDTGLTNDEKQAKQLEIDSAVDSINRLVGTTTFNGKKLLDGTYGISTTGVDTTKINDVNITSQPGAGNAAVQLTVVSAAQQAQLSWTGTKLGATNPVTLQVTGDLGSVQLGFAGNTTTSSMAATINANSAVTGVHASASGGKLYFVSQHYGADEFVRVDTLSGSFTPDSGTSLDYGKNAVVTANGQTADVDGTNISFSAGGVTGTVTMAESFAKTAGNKTTFTVGSGGATFAVSPSVTDQVNIGISDLSATKVGNWNLGYLNDLKSGGKYEAQSHAGQAAQIAGAAASQVSRTQGKIGAFQKYTINSMQNSLADSESALSSAIGSIKDTDYAMEVANMTRLNSLFQAQVSTLAMIGQQSSSIIKLLLSNN